MTKGLKGFEELPPSLAFHSACSHSSFIVKKPRPLCPHAGPPGLLLLRWRLQLSDRLGCTSLLAVTTQKVNDFLVGASVWFIITMPKQQNWIASVTHAEIFQKAVNATESKTETSQPTCLFTSKFFFMSQCLDYWSFFWPFDREVEIFC